MARPSRRPFWEPPSEGGRDDVVIATKVGVPIPGWEGSGGAAPDYVRKVLERSLTELGTDLSTST